ncbi:MAG: NAD-dependent epimerase/dehydratase family protein [Deltaproteobacteria bacterium]|nr:NAD-dependent epimerase/dehydratase family protein [Deltaproteobacteria bacterium]
MKKKKILVCGASGFVGRNVAERLAERGGAAVYGSYFKNRPASVSGVRMIKADLTNARDVSELVAGMDVIVQAAATTSGARDIVSRPHIHVTDNAVMNSLIFRAAHEHGAAHVIFPSCTVMYPSSAIPLRESDFDANAAMHANYFGVGWTKVYIEKMCEFYSRIGAAKYTVVRHSNVYGPHDKYDLERSHVFGATVAKVMGAPQGGVVVVWGEGTEERDLMHVSDLAAFVEAAIDRQEGRFELLNAGLGTSIAVRDLVKKVISHSGKELTIIFDRSKPTIMTRLCLDVEKAKKTIGWEPRVSLDEGIKSTLRWYGENIGPAARR